MSGSTAASAEEALVWLGQHPECDLVLSDMLMPGERWAAAAGSDSAWSSRRLPVVMLTAVQDVHVVTNAFRHGAIDYLLKPFERSQLLAVVERALEHGRLAASRMRCYRENLEQIYLESHVAAAGDDAGPGETATT